MRSVLYILSLFLLTFSLKPCLDKANAVPGEGQVVAVAGLHQDHQDSRPHSAPAIAAIPITSHKM